MKVETAIGYKMDNSYFLFLFKIQIILSIGHKSMYIYCSTLQLLDYKAGSITNADQAVFSPL